MLEKLCDELFNLTYYSNGYNLPIISEIHKDLVKGTILKVLNAYENEKEVKANAYEKIIANSNFAPILEQDRTKDLQKIYDRLNELTDIITCKFSDVILAIRENEK